MKNGKLLKEMLGEAFRSIVSSEEYKDIFFDKTYSKESAEKINILINKFDYLLKKIDDLDNRVLALTTAHEELLYLIDSFSEENIIDFEEDKTVATELNSKEGKFKLN